MTETKPAAKLYHNPGEKGGYWSYKASKRDIYLKDGSPLFQVVPMGIEEKKGDLVMKLSTSQGDILEPINNFKGLTVVKGNSTEYPYETDGEPLIEIHYLKIDQMEKKPRRIRATGIKFGILGDTKEENAKSGHRAMGEKAGPYLEGEDTQYNPGKSGHDGLRFFPFWRIGIEGNPKEKAIRYLPEERPKE